MAVMGFTIDAREFEDLEKRLKKHPEEGRKALYSTLGQKRAVSKVITFVSQEASADYRVKRKDIKDIARPRVVKGVNSIDVTIVFRDRLLKASRFPNTISRSRNRSPVTLKIRKQAVKSGSNPIMFGSRRTKEIYKRNVGSRDVRTVYTLSIPQMISNPEVFQRIQQKTSQYILERVNHELDYRLGLIAKK